MTHNNKSEEEIIEYTDVTGRYSSWDKYIITCKARDFFTPLKNVVKVNTTDSIKTVLSALFAYKLKALPVYDVDADKYRAFVDTFDIVSYILNVIDVAKNSKNRIDLPKDKNQIILSHEIAELDIPIGAAMNYGQENFLFMLPEDTLLREMICVMGPGAKHRVWVYNASKSQGAGLITQTKMLQLLQEDLLHFPDIANKTLASLGLDETKEIISIKTDQKVIDAFKLLTSSQVQSLAVLAEDGKLENEISANDVKALSLFGEFFENLELKIEIYFEKLRSYCSRPHHPAVCKRTDTLLEVIKRLTTNRVHHLFMVDDHERPLCVVSLGDILRGLYQFCKQ